MPVEKIFYSIRFKTNLMIIIKILFCKLIILLGFNLKFNIIIAKINLKKKHIINFIQ